MELDSLDPGSEVMTSYQKKIWKQVKSPKFKAAVGMPVLFATWTQRAAKYSRVRWPLVHQVVPDIDTIEASIKGVSSPGLIESLSHYDLNLELGRARCSSHITSLPASFEHLLGNGKIEGEENLFEQGINAIKCRYNTEFGLLGDEAKKDLEDPTVIGFKLFNNMDKAYPDALTILLNPYAFSRSTLEEWCVAAERFMIKQTKKNLNTAL